MYNIKNPSAAFIIGCWENHTEKNVIKCYENIINTIENNNSITTLILSGNHCLIDHNNQGQNNWYSNSNNIFFDNQGVDWIRKKWLEDHKNQNYFSKPCIKIKDHNWKNKNCLLAFSQWQIEYLMNFILTDIENFWYFGVGWDTGIMRDPIGWGQICDLIKHKHIKNKLLLTDNRCILTSNTVDKTFIVPDLSQSSWKNINNSNTFIKKNLDWI